MKRSETSCTQATLRLAFGVHHAPRQALASVIRQVESDAQALAVSIAAGNHKLDYIAACCGKSRSYISRLQTGSAPIPDRLVMPLCAATGTLLLRQFRDMRDALEGVTEDRTVEKLAALLRAAA
jgi:hypothetical protein